MLHFGKVHILAKDIRSICGAVSGARILVSELDTLTTKLQIAIAKYEIGSCQSLDLLYQEHRFIWTPFSSFIYTVELFHHHRVDI